MGHIEEQSSFRKPHGRSLETPDKISKCYTISITKATRYKFERRIANHIESEPPFNPINLLSIKSNVVLPTPGDFKQPDLYSRLRWRRIQYNIQHISEEFWYRWQREFLASLQCRAKWQKINRNFKIDDILFP